MPRTAAIPSRMPPRAGARRGTLSLAALLALLLGFGLELGLSSAGTAAVPPITKKILVLNFDPLLPNHGNVRLHAYYGWNDPHAIVTGYINDFYQSTTGTVVWQVVDWQDLDVWPVKLDGFAYTETSYLAAMAGGTHHTPDNVNYEAIIADYNLDARVQSGEIDEVIMIGFPWGGFYESQMVGDGAYWCNSSGLQHPGVKLYIIMGLSYERGVDCALESFGHRAESIMMHVYGSWNGGTTIRHLWDRFTKYDLIAPGQAACGNVHFPPNGVADYDWSNANPVTSAADDWRDNFPNLAGQTRVFNSGEWGATQEGYFKWWFNHIPRLAGYNSDGKLNNWWPYLTDMNAQPESGGKQLPGTPANLQAAPGSAQVDLAWDPAWGASGYSLRRGTASGGPYQAVGAPAACSFADTTAAQGVRYYYVVSAVNANGESGVSNEANALYTDSLPPALADLACVSTTRVIVLFNEALDAAAAQTTANYAVPGATVQSAVLGADSKTVTLTVATLTGGADYTLTVNGVEDLAGNPIAAGTTRDFTCTPLGTVALDGSGTAASGGSASLTWSHAVAGTNRLLLVGAAIRGNKSVTSVTYAGLSLTRLRADTVGVDVRSELWYRLAPPVGTANVIVTLAGAQNMVAGASTWTNVDQAAPLGNTAGATHPGIAGTTACLAFGTRPGQLVVDVAATQASGATLAPGAGQSQVWNRVGGAGVGAASSKPATGFATAMSWSLAYAEFWALSAVALNPAPLSAAPTATATASPTRTPTVTPTVTVSATLTEISPSPTATMTPTLTPAVETAANAVVAYPNPARGRIWFAFPGAGAESVQVEIFNLLGERVAEVRQERPAKPVAAWETGGVAPGVYWYRVSVRRDGRETRYPVKKVCVIH